MVEPESPLRAVLRRPMTPVKCSRDSLPGVLAESGFAKMHTHSTFSFVKRLRSKGGVGELKRA